MKRFILALLAPVFAGVAFIAPAQATVEAKAPAAAVAFKPGPAVAKLSYGISPNGQVVPLSADAKARAQSLTCTPQPDGKCYWYEDGMFAQRNICFQNNLGVYWNYQSAQAGFTSGTSTVNFYNHGPSTPTPGPCTSPPWNNWQILTYQAYTTNDGQCAHVEITPDASGYWNANGVIWMNASANRPPTCTDTTQHKNNVVSRAIGAAIGLANFSSSTNLTASVMNTYFSYAYNFPGVDDRNALYWRYILQ